MRLLPTKCVFSVDGQLTKLVLKSSSESSSKSRRGSQAGRPLGANDWIGSKGLAVSPLRTILCSSSPEKRVGRHGLEVAAMLTRSWGLQKLFSASVKVARGCGEGEGVSEGHEVADNK